MVKNVDFRKPLTPKILSNPNHEFVKTLIYIYSMESFIFQEMNLTARTKNIDRINYYGPLASALSFIVHCGNKQNTDLSKEFTVYRGYQVDKEEFEAKYKVGSSIHFQGFTSTTRNKDVALKYAADGYQEDKNHTHLYLVLAVLKMRGNQQLFSLNTAELSAFPEEKEILLQDGVEYQVTSCQTITETVEIKRRHYIKEIKQVTLEKKIDNITQMGCLTRSLKMLIN